MKKCYPLELVNRVANKYQDCWNIVEDFRNDSTLPWWDKRCYIPIAAGLAIAADGDMSKKAIWNSSLEADLIVATAAWRLHKQVYLFDPAMEKVLINQADQNLKIPIDILNKIPFFCVYIETTTMEDMDGFFVHFESDTNTGELELRFLIVLKDGDIFPIPFHLIEGGTIADGINASFEKANENGYKVDVTEIENEENPGIIYQDEYVSVEAFPVSHGTLTCYGYKFVTADRTIVISGDTAPLELVAQKASGCDILLHEVEYSAGISAREPKWQKYHREVHTLSTDLAWVAKKAQPKLLVTYHRIYHMNIQDNHINLAAEMARRDEAILDEIKTAGYEGYTVNGRDLDVF